MIKHSPLAHQVSERLPMAEAYLQQRKEIWFAYLFGSFASGRIHPLSDVDIAVYLDDREISEKRLEISGNLANILKTDEIDLVVLNSAPLPLQMKILQHRKVIADNLPFKRHIFESLTVRSYLDFSKLERRLLERRFFNG